MKDSGPEAKMSESILYITLFCSDMRLSEFSLRPCSVVSFFVWDVLCCMACGILVPQPGIKPMTSAMKEQSPNHWTAMEFPCSDVAKLPVGTS